MRLSKKTIENATTLARALAVAILPMQRQTNAEYANTVSYFREACARVGIAPTARQASKWRRRRGLAYTQGR